MQEHSRKKLIGTAIFVVAIIIASLAGASMAGAQFLQTRTTMIADGVVSSIGASSFTMNTPGATGIVITINSKTLFNNGLALVGMNPGDRVSVIAKKDGGANLAKIVKLLSGSGYGTQGDSVTVVSATVTGKTSNSITVNTGTSIITFKVTSSTNFLRTNFSSLAIGQRVRVFGFDAGSYFEAKTVIAR